MDVRPIPLLILAVLALPAASVNAQSTAFMYRGHLIDNGQPATGLYDFRFSLFDTSTGGVRIGSPVITNGVPTTNGWFQVALDFGNAFTGADRWLQLSVKTNLLAFYSFLTPRQKIMPVPYAIMAGNLSGSLPASQLAGTISLAQLPDLFVTNINANGAIAPSLGSFYRDWMHRDNASPYNLNRDGAWTVVAASETNLWATNYVMLTNFPGIEGSCVFVAMSNNVNVPSLYWTFTNLDNIRGIDVEVLWVTNGANTSAISFSRSLNISFTERAQLVDGGNSSLFLLNGTNGGHFNFHSDGVQLDLFTNFFYVGYTAEDHLGRKWINSWEGKESPNYRSPPKHGSIWHCGFEFMSPTTIRAYAGPNEWIRSLDLFTNFDNVRSFWLESVARDSTNLAITACIRSLTVFTHQKNAWPRWFYMTTNGMVLTRTVVTN